MLNGLVAYPSEPRQIGTSIRGALTELEAIGLGDSLTSWTENDVAGRFLAEPILDRIDQGDLLIADITTLNFNVTFEIGYAIGREKRAYLIRNSTLVGSDLVDEIGIFDTLGYESYETATELASILRSIDSTEPLPLPVESPARNAPVFLVLPRKKSDAEVRLTSRIKKARLAFRTFDPEEQFRLSASEAIRQVGISWAL